MTNITTVKLMTILLWRHFVLNYKLSLNSTSVDQMEEVMSFTDVQLLKYVLTLLIC